jgi:hypothetical protein
MELKVCNTEFNVRAVRSKYQNNGSLAVILMDNDTEETVAVITVNLPEGFAGDEYQYVDTNNCQWAPKFLDDNKLAEPVGFSTPSGFCSYPLYKFDLSLIEEIE